MNSICWAPHSAQHICSVGDDKRALIWDLEEASPEVNTPVLEFKGDKDIHGLDWSKSQNDWIGVAYGKTAEILRVY